MSTPLATAVAAAPPAPAGALRRILCAIDFSPASSFAVAEAVALARASRGEITILFVLPCGPPSREDRPPVPDGVMSTVAGDVEALVQPARAVGIPVRVCLKAGDPVREILATIERMDPDIVVMGTHGRGGFKRRLLGSVTSAVLREVRCPVMTVARREAATPTLSPHHHSIVCAVSLSPSSPRTLAFACAVARAAGARLTVMHVLTDHDPAGEREAAARLHAASTLAAAYGLGRERVEEAVVAGNAAREILRLAAARSAGMVVIGAHRPVTALSGSIPDKLIGRARCAVLTVRGPS